MDYNRLQKHIVLKNILLLMNNWQFYIILDLPCCPSILSSQSRLFSFSVSVLFTYFNKKKMLCQLVYFNFFEQINLSFVWFWYFQHNNFIHIWFFC